MVTLLMASTVSIVRSIQCFHSIRSYDTLSKQFWHCIGGQLLAVTHPKLDRISRCLTCRFVGRGSYLPTCSQFAIMVGYHNCLLEKR